MKILILAGRGDFSNAVINSIRNDFDEVSVIIEEPVPRLLFLKRRIKKLGLATVVGQVLFQAIIVPILNRKSFNRITEIKKESNLDYSDRWKALIEWKHVKSINDEETIKFIHQYNPNIIVINGTRIISTNVLNATRVPFINLHMGITPKYRGVHGGYWAVSCDDYDNCGVTVHLVSSGIDTGDVIIQARIQVTNRDSFVTYPYLQATAGIPLEKKVLYDFEKTGTIDTKKINLPSKLWSHPTLWQYLSKRG